MLICKHVRLETNHLEAGFLEKLRNLARPPLRAAFAMPLGKCPAKLAVAEKEAERRALEKKEAAAAARKNARARKAAEKANAAGKPAPRPVKKAAEKPRKPAAARPAKKSSSRPHKKK